MGQSNAIRTQIQEGRYVFTKKDLAHVLLELQTLVTGADCYIDVDTRDSNDHPTMFTYYSDAARTDKIAEKTLTWTEGPDGFWRITDVLWKFFNDDATEDSRVTTTISRDGDDLIEDCDGVFSSGESQKL